MMNTPSSVLKDDSLLVNQLKSHLNYVCEQMSKAENRMNVLDKDTSDFHIRLQNIQNTMCALKHKRYVQELIIDEDGDRPLKQQEIKMKSINSDVELRDSIAKATSEGLEMISKMFKPIAIQIPNQVLSSNLIPNDIYEAMDSHLMRDLPPIIGSSSFRLWNAAEVIDRSIETNEITIGNASIKQHSMTQKFSSTLSESSTIQETSSQIPVPPPPMPAPRIQRVAEPSVSNQEDNDLLKQLSERLAQKDITGSSSNIKPEISTKNQTVSKASQKLLDNSSSDEELFAKRPVESKLIESQTIVVKSLDPNPVESVVNNPQTIQTIHNIQTSHNAKQALPKKSMPVKEVPTKSLMDEESDDSFDEMFKQPQKSISKSKPVVEKPKVNEVNEQLPTNTRPTNKSTEVPKNQQDQPISKPATIKSSKSVKRQGPEPKKRSLFDSTSSEDEQDVKVEESSDEDMPKGVLNSVPNDFSSRLNQALKKRPSPVPSSSVVKSTSNVEKQEKVQEKVHLNTEKQENVQEKPIPSTVSTTTVRKREPVDHKKQESVAALRDKIGGSITKAHTGSRLSADTLDFKKPPSSSSDEETRKVGSRPDDNTLIQTLKARPKPPGRNTQRSRPPVLHDEKPSLKIEKKPIEVLEKPSLKIEEKPSLKIEEKPKLKIEEKPKLKIEEKPGTKAATSQLSNKPVIKPASKPVNTSSKSRKGLFDSDSDDPF